MAARLRSIARGVWIAQIAPLLLLLESSVVHCKDNNPVFSPCGDTKVQISDGFTFGLVFNSNSSFFQNRVQLSPCDRRLDMFSGNMALFRPKVDEIGLLTINASSFAPQDSGGYMVAFAGSQFAATSYPRFVADNTYIITSFSLVLEFDKGRLISFLWKNDGCTSCQGNSSFICIRGQDCAIHNSQCTNRGGKVDCSLSIQLTFSGTDKNDAVFNSWYQVNSLHQYSLYNLYSNLRNSLTSQYSKFF